MRKLYLILLLVGVSTNAKASLDPVAVDVNAVTSLPGGIHGAVQVVFDTEVGQLYQLQFSTDMSDFQNVGHAIQGTGSPASFYFSTEGYEQLFLRVTDNADPENLALLINPNTARQQLELEPGVDIQAYNPELQRLSERGVTDHTRYLASMRGLQRSLHFTLGEDSGWGYDLPGAGEDKRTVILFWGDSVLALSHRAFLKPLVDLNPHQTYYDAINPREARIPFESGKPDDSRYDGRHPGAWDHSLIAPSHLRTSWYVVTGSVYNKNNNWSDGQVYEAILTGAGLGLLAGDYLRPYNKDLAAIASTTFTVFYYRRAGGGEFTVQWSVDGENWTTEATISTEGETGVGAATVELPLGDYHWRARGISADAEAILLGYDCYDKDLPAIHGLMIGGNSQQTANWLTMDEGARKDLLQLIKPDAIFIHFADPEDAPPNNGDRSVMPNGAWSDAMPLLYADLQATGLDETAVMILSHADQNNVDYTESRKVIDALCRTFQWIHMPLSDWSEANGGLWNDGEEYADSYTVHLKENFYVGFFEMWRSRLGLNLPSYRAPLSGYRGPDGRVIVVLPEEGLEFRGPNGDTWLRIDEGGSSMP